MRENLDSTDKTKVHPQQSEFIYDAEYQTLTKTNHGTESTIALSTTDIPVLYLYLLDLLHKGKHEEH